MEFFGYTLLGPQNYIKDTLKSDYNEPVSKNEAESLLEKIKMNLKAEDNQIKGQDNMDIIQVIDCYIGRVNGFAYGSSQRLNKMKRKGVIKPVGPMDMYRIPPTSSVEYGWWQQDSALSTTTWYITHPRRPQPSSPNTLILDTVRKNNKYATLF